MGSRDLMSSNLTHETTVPANIESFSAVSLVLITLAKAVDDLQNGRLFVPTTQLPSRSKEGDAKYFKKSDGKLPEGILQEGLHIYIDEKWKPVCERVAPIVPPTPEENPDGEA